MKRLLCLATLALAACGGSRLPAAVAFKPVLTPLVDAGGPRDGAPQGRTAAPADAGARASDSRFDIAERGKAPWHVLERRLSPGAEQQLDLSTVTRVMHKDSELAASVVEAPVDVQVRQVAPDGTARFVATLGPFHYRTRGDPKLVRMMTQGAARSGVLGGKIEGYARVTPRGVIEHVHFEGSKQHPKPVAMALAASLMSSAEALPPGKLGTGARWRVHSSADVRGNEIDLVARYQIVSLGAGSVRLRVEHEQPEFAPGDSPDNPRVVKTESEGEWVYYLDRVFPEGNEVLKRRLPIPGTNGLQLWSEVHLVAR